MPTTEAKKHPYPSHYRPGTHWAIDESWRILDTLPVGMLPDEYRFLIGGMIAGALMRHDARDLLTASHVLKSYAHRNASSDLAASVAAVIDSAVAQLVGGAGA